MDKTAAAALLIFANEVGETSTYICIKLMFLGNTCINLLMVYIRKV